MRSKYTILAGLFLLLLASCDPRMVYDEFRETKGNEWSWDDKKQYEFTMDQPDKYYNIFVNVRHTKEYPKSNLYVFMTIEGPNESMVRDTIDIAIANERGKWLGSGFGDIKFVRKKIRERVRFAKQGRYRITIEQGMRLERVPVTDVGIRIEEYKSLK